MNNIHPVIEELMDKANRDRRFETKKRHKRDNPHCPSANDPYKYIVKPGRADRPHRKVPRKTLTSHERIHNYYIRHELYTLARLFNR